MCSKGRVITTAVLHMKDQRKIKNLCLQIWNISYPGETYAEYFQLWKVLSSDCEYKDSFLLHNDYMPDIHKQIEEEIH